MAAAVTLVLVTSLSGTAAAAQPASQPVRAPAGWTTTANTYGYWQACRPISDFDFAGTLCIDATGPAPGHGRIGVGFWRDWGHSHAVKVGWDYVYPATHGLFTPKNGWIHLPSGSGSTGTHTWNSYLNKGCHAYPYLRIQTAGGGYRTYNGYYLCVG